MQLSGPDSAVKYKLFISLGLGPTGLLFLLYPNHECLCSLRGPYSVLQGWTSAVKMRAVPSERTPHTARVLLEEDIGMQVGTLVLWLLENNDDDLVFRSCIYSLYCSGWLIEIP